MKKPWGGGESLSRTHRALCRQWHPTKNGALTPDRVSHGSERLVWWRCRLKRTHVWQSAIKNRTGKGYGCPLCSGKRASPGHSLADLHPRIAAFWDDSKNGGIQPREVPPRSRKSFWWCCPKGKDHRWFASVSNLTRRGAGCPFCSGKRASASHSVAAEFPKVARYWHPARNGELTPAEISPYSNLPRWWKCPRGSDHEWQAPPARLCTSPGSSGCPFCRGIQVSVTNSLARKFPKIARQWHPTLNGTLRPDQVVAGRMKYAWWRCSNGPDHVWRALIQSRTALNLGCSFCSNKRVSVTNSLATRFPALAREWHPRKNGRLKPGSVVSGSHRKVWWRCASNPLHEWAAAIASRTRLKSGCPHCARMRVPESRLLINSHPEIAAQWHPTRNPRLQIERIAGDSYRAVWWRCRKTHVWRATLFQRTQAEEGCPECEGR